MIEFLIKQKRKISFLLAFAIFINCIPVYALDAKSGKLKWKYKIGNSLVNTVLPLSAKEVAVTSSDGTIAILCK